MADKKLGSVKCKNMQKQVRSTPNKASWTIEADHAASLRFRRIKNVTSNDSRPYLVDLVTCRCH